MESKALSDKEIYDYMDGKVNIYTYEDLHKFQNIDQLLGRYQCCIILFCYEPNRGHWVTVFVGGDGKLHFFNSYGNLKNKYDGYPDEFLTLINKKYRRESHQDYPYLSDLLLNSEYELEYNDYPFQSLAQNIKTCGRWSVLRLRCSDLTDNQFINFVKENCEYNKISQDEFVCLIIN